MRVFNIFITTWYTLGIFIEFYSGIEGAYMLFDIFLLIIAFIIYAGITYSYIYKKIELNYWILVLLLIRINLGLV